MKFNVGTLFAASVFALWAGAASAHVTAFDPGVPPGDMQNGQVTLPSGQTAPVLTKDQCEAQKQADESCSGGTGYFIITDAPLASGATISFTGMVGGKSTSGSARVGTGGLVAVTGGGASGGSLFSQRGGIETVISSAQKKSESVQEVPIPVTAFSGVAIERKFAVNLEDLNKLAPGVQLQHVGLFHNASSFTVRGIGTALCKC